MTNKEVGRVSIVPKGEWASEVAYERLDLVSYNGGSYLAKISNTASNPSTSADWIKISGGIKSVEYTDDVLIVTESDGTEHKYEGLKTAITYMADTESAVERAESNRVYTEYSRASAESTRESNEKTRTDNETTRTSNETTRTDNETIRVNAESSRVSAENTRKTNEESRIANEIKKVNVTVNNSVGTPSAAVTKSGNDLSIDFVNLKGNQGDKGDTGDCCYPEFSVNPATGRLSVSGADQASLSYTVNNNGHLEVELL